ncbi:hepatocyte nuclear factor 6 [Caerostris extrusa]|uniref:Hepatocyte nuclear factor 6 n=1 Tax=Caerostris extrusa TaxID=172846 RepID=A0AAV4SPT3_CAEEX|nr:hepatocyte nuclear factor 6 [Caerostris extrusa]
MQNNLGMNFQYEKLTSINVMNLSPTLGITNTATVTMLAANGLSSQSPPYPQNGIHTPEKSSPTRPNTNTQSTKQAFATHDSAGGQSGPLQRPLNVALSLASAIPVPVHVTVQPAATIVRTPPQQPQQVVVATPVVQPQPPPQQPQQTQPQQPQNPQSTPPTNKTVLVATAVSPSSAKSSGDEVEEINTKELAQRISAELKRYSIPGNLCPKGVVSVPGDSLRPAKESEALE